MPQLDIFIFINSGIYLFIGFFVLLAYIHIYILPSLASLIKLRKKMVVATKAVSELSVPKLNSWSVDKLLVKNGSL